MAENFQPGDVVQLKSGGPAMTVTALDSEEAKCEWFDDKNQPHRRLFALSSLTKYEDF